MRWFKCEYFYSWIDKPFFLSNDFKQLLVQLDMRNLKLSKIEWSIFRKMLATNGDSSIKYKPRKFSEYFVREERERLYAYREVFREIVK
jgi:Iap family predicted aminopeptidase